MFLRKLLLNLLGPCRRRWTRNEPSWFVRIGIGWHRNPMHTPLNVFRRIYSGELVNGKLVSLPFAYWNWNGWHVNCDIVKWMVVWCPLLAHTISINLTCPSINLTGPPFPSFPRVDLLMVVAVINLRAVAISMPINGSPTFQKKEGNQHNSTTLDVIAGCFPYSTMITMVWGVMLWFRPDIFGNLRLATKVSPCLFLPSFDRCPLDSFGTYGNSPLHELYFQRFGRWRNWQFLLHRFRNKINKQKTSFFYDKSKVKKTQRFTSPKKMAS